MRGKSNGDMKKCRERRYNGGKGRGSKLIEQKMTFQWLVRGENGNIFHALHTSLSTEKWNVILNIEKHRTFRSISKKCKTSAVRKEIKILLCKTMQNIFAIAIKNKRKTDDVLCGKWNKLNIYITVFKTGKLNSIIRWI